MNIIPYKKVKDRIINLWHYDEGNPKTDKNRTAIIWIHGGGWRATDPGYFGDNYYYFTKKNAVCFSVDYRLIPNEIDEYCNFLEDCINDCFDAIEYVRKNSYEYGIDPQKIVVIGESAGGHLALCTATDVVNKFNVRAIPNMVIAYNPVTNIVGKWGESACKLERSLNVEEFMKRNNRLLSMCPDSNIIKSGIPLLLLTGLDDKVVHPGDVLSFYRRYKEAGNESEIVFYPNTAHAFALPNYYKGGLESLYDSLDKIVKFMKVYGFL